jgi:hypothetical protein
MRTKFLIATIFSITTFLSSCNRNDLNIKDGTYKGTFTVTYSSGIKSGQTILELKDGKFVSSGNTNRIPAGGSGTFSPENKKITFNDENPWTADFDWNLILNGKYDYAFDGKKLILSADKNGAGNYRYDLEKQ